MLAVSGGDNQVRVYKENNNGKYEEVSRVNEEGVLEDLWIPLIKFKLNILLISDPTGCLKSWFHYQNIIFTVKIFWFDKI